MATAAQKKAQIKYDKDNTCSYIFKFNRKTDADIIIKLDEVKNRQGYIKSLVRNDILGDGDVVEINSLKTLIAPFTRKYLPDRIYLFGSYARGEASPESDIDIYVQGGSIDTIDKYLEAKSSIEKVTGKIVDLLIDSSIDRKSRSGKRLLQHIERDKVLLYETV